MQQGRRLEKKAEFHDDVFMYDMKVKTSSSKIFLKSLSREQLCMENAGMNHDSRVRKLLNIKTFIGEKRETIGEFVREFEIVCMNY